MNRRVFLAVSAAAAVAKSAVRTIQAGFWGSEFYDDAEQQQLTDVLANRNPFRWYGPKAPVKVATFEKEFAARMQTKYALAVTSGTAALQCAVNALGIGPGDEVILPAWTWHSCYAAVVLAGALPVFAEIDSSFNIDPADIEHRITPQTRAILAAHLQGNACDMDRVLEIARRHKLRVIEDCAQSLGATYKGRPVGSLGDVGIYSFQLNKTITAGEGGAVVSSDPELFERAARFHDVGIFRVPHQKLVGQARLQPFAGTNFRMSEFTGGVMLAQVRKLDRIVGAVRANAQRVYEGVRGLPGVELRLLADPQGELGTGIFLGFRNKEQRDRYMAAMKTENVPASPPGGSALLPVQPYIEKKMTVHPAWPSFTSERGKAIQYGSATCPRTIEVLDRFAGVLMDPKFTKRETDDIVAAMRRAYSQVTA